MRVFYSPEHDDLAGLPAVVPEELEQEVFGDHLHVLDNFLVLSASLDTDLALVEGGLRVHGADDCGNGRLLNLDTTHKYLLGAGTILNWGFNETELVNLAECSY